MFMQEIQKLKDGRRVSRDEYAQAKLAYEAAYADADADTKAKLDGLMQSSLNFSSANPMNNRSAREYQTQLYRNALSVAKSESTPGAAPGVGTANMFNGYSHIENENNANNVTARYLSHANGTPGAVQGTLTDTATSPATSATGTSTGYYRFNGMKGLNGGWGLDTDTLDQRMESFASGLQSNIEDALKSGKTIIGTSADKLQLAAAMLQNGSWKGNFRNLMTIAKLSGVNRADFNDYFGNLIPGMSAIDKNKKEYTTQGYKFLDTGDYGEDMNKRIADNGWKVAEKDGKYYIFNSDYSGPVTGQAGAFLNTDYTDPTKEGFGWAQGDDGEFIFGDMNSHATDQNSKWYNAVLNYLSQQGNNDRWAVTARKFDEFGTTSNYDIVNKNALALADRKFVDLSKYFDGKEVIATVDGDNFDAYKSKYGHLKLNDPRFHFYYKGKDGNTYEGNLLLAEQALGTKMNLNSTANSLGIADLTYKDYNLGGLSQLEQNVINNKDVNGRSGWHNWWSKDIAMKNPWSGETVDTDHAINSTYGNHENKADKVARLLLYVAGNWNDLIKKTDRESKQMVQTYEYWLGPSAPQDRVEGVIRMIYDSMRTHRDGYRNNYDNYRKAFQLILNSRDAILSNAVTSTEPLQAKEGGVLKAATGAALDASGLEIVTDKLQGYAASVRDKGNSMIAEQKRVADKANQNGRTTTQLRAIDRGEWTAADTARAIALAGDVSGLVAAIAAPGAGSLYAVGEGVASTLVDFGADLADDKVSAGQAWKNLGINAGLTAGAMFGAKAPKIIKGVTRILPKAMMALGTAGIAFDPEIHKTVAKVADGKDLDTNDWKNVIYVLRMATGMGTMAATRIQSSHGEKNYAKSVKDNIKKMSANSEVKKGVKQAFDGKDIVEVEETRFNAATNELKKGNTDEHVNKALEILTEEKDGKQGITLELATGIIERISGKKPISERLKFWGKNKTTTDTGIARIREVTPLMSEELNLNVPEESLAKARLDAIQQIRNKPRNQHYWFGTSDKAKAFQDRFNPYLNAPLAAEYNNSNKIYNTLGDYEVELKSKASKPMPKKTEVDTKSTTKTSEPTTAKPSTVKSNSRTLYTRFRGSIEGKDIKKNTKLNSFTHIKDEASAKEVATKDKNMKLLDVKSVRQLFAKNQQKVIRGGAIDNATGEIVVWKQGGEMKVNYAKLRK